MERGALTFYNEINRFYISLSRITRMDADPLYRSVYSLTIYLSSSLSPWFNLLTFILIHKLWQFVWYLYDLQPYVLNHLLVLTKFHTCLILSHLSISHIPLWQSPQSLQFRLAFPWSSFWYTEFVWSLVRNKEKKF